MHVFIHIHSIFDVMHWQNICKTVERLSMLNNIQQKRMPDQSSTDKSPGHIFSLILLLTLYLKLKIWNLLVPSERSSSDLSEYTLFQIVAKLFWLVARFVRVGILNSRPDGSREVLVSVSESHFPFYSILLTLALFLCS